MDSNASSVARITKILIFQIHCKKEGRSTRFCSELSSLTSAGVMGLFNILLHATFYGNENGPCMPISSALGIAREIPMEGFSAGAEYFLFQHSDAGT